MSRLRGPAFAVTVLGAVGAWQTGCVPSNHPLGAGSVEFLFDQTQPIYAGDVIDENGAVVLPRQEPFDKRVQLRMLSSNQPDPGGFVDIQVSPPDVLELLVDPGENPEEATCEQLPGVFRCTAGDDGLAQFIVRSSSDWSGTAQVKLTGRTETANIVVNPAGLPNEASNFEMLIEGLSGTSVPARYNSLECTLQPEPDEAFEKWPSGAIRVREATVRASAPLNSPGVIEHAPVILESLHPELRLALSKTCEERVTRLRVQLDALGTSPPFYMCFSDLGGPTQIGFRSGLKVGDTRNLTVDPEPRLLRLLTTETTVNTNTGPVQVLTLAAFNSDLDKVSFNVDVISNDPSVLRPVTSDTNVVLPNEGEDVRAVQITPLAAGSTTLTVTPELHATPACESLAITVVDPLQ